MPKKLNLVGEVYGRLTVLEEAEKIKGRVAWLCQCECGTLTVVKSKYLRNQDTKSCGCLEKEAKQSFGKTAKTTHSMTNTKEYKCWAAIKQRCYNPSNKAYVNYGERGITMCNEWKDDFEAFYNYVGKAPCSSASIDRIDNNGKYEPGNVRWVANQSIQCINKRTAKNNTSGVKGVYWVKSQNLWKATIFSKGKEIYLGSYKNIDDAINARKEAEIKYYNINNLLLENDYE